MLHSEEDDIRLDNSTADHLATKKESASSAKKLLSLGDQFLCILLPKEIVEWQLHSAAASLNPTVIINSLTLSNIN